MPIKVVTAERIKQDAEEVVTADEFSTFGLPEHAHRIGKVRTPPLSAATAAEMSRLSPVAWCGCLCAGVSASGIEGVGLLPCKEVAATHDEDGSEDIDTPSCEAEKESAISVLQPENGSPSVSTSVGRCATR